MDRVSRADCIAGWESDRWRLMLYDRAKARSDQSDRELDRNVESFAWTPDSKSDLFRRPKKKPKCRFIRLLRAAGSAPKAGSGDSFNDEIDSQPAMVAMLVFTRTSLTMPAEIFTANADGTNVAADYASE